MKLTGCLSASLFALLAFPAALRAAAPDAPVNPYADLDPDGVPLSISQTHTTYSPEQVELYAKQQAEMDARARNWLLIDYEQRSQHNKAESSPNNQTINMYLQLSMNRDFTAVVNQDSVNPEAAPPPPSLHAAPDNSSQKGMTLRPDTAPSKEIFAPLISPLSSPAALSAAQPFNVSAYAAALPPSLAPTSALDAPPQQQGPAPAPELKPPSPTDTIDMQTPGAVADKADPLPGAPDLNLDSLPDPNGTNRHDQAQPGALPELPQVGQAMDAGLLHEEMKAKLNSGKPVPANAQPQDQQPAKPTAPPPPEAPSPINQQPQLSPVHAPLPSPFDILNH
jgi:hypothetical protein